MGVALAESANTIALFGVVLAESASRGDVSRPAEETDSG